MFPALLLTAGLGTRFDPLTRLVAKPAVPLAGRTLVERVLDGLRLQGVTEVVLNLHHRPETITAVVGDGAHLGLRVRYSWERPVLGSAGGPRRALPLLSAPRFAIVNGDTLSDVSLAALTARHVRSGARVTMAVVPNPAPHHYNGVSIDDAGRVTGFVPRGPAARGTHHYIGVQIVEADVFAGLADGVPAESVGGVYRDLVATHPGQVCAMVVETPFDDVGTPADYLAAALRLGRVGPDGSVIDAPPGSVATDARLVRTVVWPTARIADGVILEDCIVAGDVTVPRGYTASRMVLVPAAIARPGEARTTDGLAAIPI